MMGHSDDDSDEVFESLTLWEIFKGEESESGLDAVVQDEYLMTQFQEDRENEIDNEEEEETGLPVAASPNQAPPIPKKQKNDRTSVRQSHNKMVNKDVKSWCHIKI